MIRIYREAFRYFLTSLPLLIAFSALAKILLWVLEPKSKSAITLVPLIILAYYFHRHFLFGEPISLWRHTSAVSAPPVRFGRFFLVNAALLFGPLALGLVLAFSVLGRPSPDVFVLIFLLLYLLGLSMFGTALPATVAQDSAYRLSTGLRLTLSTMWRLVLGPGLVGLASLAATAFGSLLLGKMGFGEHSLVILAFYIVMSTIGLLSTILAVAVLCEMYRKGRPAPRRDQIPASQAPGLT